jgi:signal peptidase I
VGAGPGRHRAGAAGPDPDEEDEAPATGSAGTGRRRAGGSGPGRKPKVGRNGKPKRKGSFWRELPLLIVVAVVLTFVIQTFLARIYVIPSASMERTLHGCSGCNNDRVAVDKVSYRFSDPSPGDVVVFRGPATWGDNGEVSNDRSGNVFVRGLQSGLSLLGLAPPDEKDFVKRVIAVGGQTVSCCDPQNRVLVDGRPLTEPYLYFQPNLGRTQQDFAPVVVPPGQLWVMGDNRNNSADARVHGPISTTDVIGKARVIVLPVGRWGSVPDTDPQTRVAALGPSEPGPSPLGAPGWADGLAPVAGLVGAVPFVGLSRRLRRRALVRAGDRGTGEDPDADLRDAHPHGPDPHGPDPHEPDPSDRSGTHRSAPPDTTAR